MFSFMGALMAMEDNGILSGVKSISGASAGAIAGFALLMERVKGGSVWKGFRYPSKPEASLSNILEQDGIANIYNYIEDFKDFMDGEDYTFKQLYDLTGVHFTVAAYCIDDRETVHFSHESHPDTPISLALGATMAVPFLLSTVTIEGKRYLDGGLDEKVPFNPTCSKETTCIMECNYVDGKATFSNSDDKSILSIGYALLDVIMKNRRSAPDEYPRLYIPCLGEDCFKFDMLTENKMKLFTMGYRSIILILRDQKPNSTNELPREDGDGHSEGRPPQVGTGVQ